jgi:hypothetical protein
MPLTGRSFIGSQRGVFSGAAIQAINPVTGAPLEPDYASASSAEVESAAELAALALSSLQLQAALAQRFCAASPTAWMLCNSCWPNVPILRQRCPCRVCWVR